MPINAHIVHANIGLVLARYTDTLYWQRGSPYVSHVGLDEVQINGWI